MPLYRYKCHVCDEVIKFLTDEPPEAIPCNGICNGNWLSPTAFRDRKPSTTQNVEILDNGLAAKPVERYSDAERLFTERAQKHTLEHQEDGSDTHT